MKTIRSICLALCLVALTACASTAPPETNSPTPTGQPSGQIQRPYVRYDSKLYAYEFTGFDLPLPVGSEKVGEIESIDNYNMPEEDFTGAVVDVGQAIYTNEDFPENIYVEYDNGYAAFTVTVETV